MIRWRYALTITAWFVCLFLIFFSPFFLVLIFLLMCSYQRLIYWQINTIRWREYIGIYIYIYESLRTIGKLVENVPMKVVWKLLHHKRLRNVDNLEMVIFLCKISGLSGKQIFWKTFVAKKDSKDVHHAIFLKFAYYSQWFIYIAAKTNEYEMLSHSFCENCESFSIGSFLIIRCWLLHFEWQTDIVFEQIVLHLVSSILYDHSFKP